MEGDGGINGGGDGGGVGVWGGGEEDVNGKRWFVSEYELA